MCWPCCALNIMHNMSWHCEICKYVSTVCRYRRCRRWPSRNVSISCRSPRHLPLQLSAWTKQVPHIAVLECYADLAIQGFLTKSVQPPQSLAAILAITHLHASCFGIGLQEPPHKLPQQMTSMAKRHSSEMPAASAPEKVNNDDQGGEAVCISPESSKPAEAFHPFVKPSNCRAPASDSEEKLHGLVRRLKLSCPADLLAAIADLP